MTVVPFGWRSLIAGYSRIVPDRVGALVLWFPCCDALSALDRVPAMDTPACRRVGTGTM